MVGDLFQEMLSRHCGDGVDWATGTSERYLENLGVVIDMP